MHLNQNVFFAYCQQALQFLSDALAPTPHPPADPPAHCPSEKEREMGEVYYDGLTSSGDMLVATAACILAIPALLC